MHKDLLSFKQEEPNQSIYCLTKPEINSQNLRLGPKNGTLLLARPPKLHDRKLCIQGSHDLCLLRLPNLNLKLKFAGKLFQFRVADFQSIAVFKKWGQADGQAARRALGGWAGLLGWLGHFPVPNKEDEAAET